MEGEDPDVFLVSLAKKLQQNEGDEESSARVADKLALSLLQEHYEVMRKPRMIIANLLFA